MPKKNRRPDPRTLRVWRAEREMTQKIIADDAFMTQTRYWQIENGEGAPARRQEQTAIARVLKVHVLDIAWPELQPTPLQRMRAHAREEREERRRAAELAGLR
jgi:transcriptional regulator with XRE-family HTH domain